MATTWWDPDANLDAVAGALVPADYGDKIKDNLKFLGNPPQARAYYSTTQNAATATVVPVFLNTERYDTDNLHDNLTNATRMTCVKAGVHHAFGWSTFSGSAGGSQRSLLVRLNGVTTIAQIDEPRNGAASTAVAISTDYKLALGDYLELCVFHDAGVTLTVQPEFGMRWSGFG